MAEKRKIVIIGVDGGTFDLVKPWIAQGHLAHFKRLMDEGCHAVMHAPVGAPISPASWSSFATGLTPAGHGILDFVKLSSRVYARQIQTSRVRRGQTLWGYFSERGRTVGISEVPLTYPPDTVNGFMVSGHPALTLKKSFTYPESLTAELLKAVPDFVSSAAKIVRVHRSPGDKYAEFAKWLYRTAESRLRSGLWLYDRFKPDLFCQELMGTDWASHYYWHFMDPESPFDITAEERRRYSKVILDMYEAADQFIAEMLARVDANTVVIAMSDHGFCPTYRVLNVRQWLADRGLLTFTQRRTNVPLRLAHWLWWTLKRVLPERAADWLNTHFPRAMRRARGMGEFAAVDFSRTKAYPLGSFRHIYVNVRGRQPQGIVEPGEEYERLRDRIIREFDELRAPDTGHRLVRKVHRREELMNGPFLDEAPDLLIEWADHTFAFAGAEAGPGPVFSPLGLSKDRWLRSANHDPRGILLVWGPGIEPGRELPDCSITDVLPTVMYAAGEPVPEGLDGRVLEEAFSESFRRSNPLAYFHSEGDAAQEGAQAFTGAENEEVAEHLRGLGYLD